MFYITDIQVQNRTKRTYNVYYNNNKLCKTMDCYNIKMYYKLLTSLKKFLASYKYYNRNFFFIIKYILIILHVLMHRLSLIKLVKCR